ncbi:MAG: hypothetical protein BGO27_05565 [Alphaproteobacteria bacterium 33-17]|nr:MAG: hypothetical protein BGO27_05565 [Alphaproteobacteria bacterium 33-17]
MQHSIENIKERLAEMQGFRPEKVLDIGARKGYFEEYENILGTELHESLKPEYNNTLICDDEFLPFDEGSFDLIISVLNNHFINDLPGHLIQAKNILLKGGLYISSFLGGRTLHELREAMLNYEINYSGEVTPHISPMIDIRDAASLMQRCGFEGAAVDIETIEIEYPDVLKLMHDLRGMGETNCLIQSGYKLKKDAIDTINNIYKDICNGKILATFEIITATGFKK